MKTRSDLIQDILLAAVEIEDLQQRADYLSGACGADTALRREVQELLQANAAAGAFLGATPARDLAREILRKNAAVLESCDPLSGIPFCEKPGDSVGRYRLIEKIGEGGCGVVYLAEQREPVFRRVALKVIKLGMDTLQVIARFEAERQALALMDHPNIAKVLDAGVTEAGRSFFVMELVLGVKITSFCDENQLSIRGRLQLFIRLCQAVEHAHQKGIIHRDLKPSNILVSWVDGVPAPKVIDFGIAKATEARLTDKTLVTALEQFMGTPAYMSPEQAQMTNVDIDTRSDVYSLGVLLYELLTGKTPFENNTLLALGLDEMRRTVRDDEPPRPSAKAAQTAGVDLARVAANRSTEPGKLINLIKGDLDWIAMKCLEKDRSRRYGTANNLATDIQRHLQNEPVTACPPSPIYLLRKSVRRHKLAVTAGVVVVLALTTGILVATREAVSAWRAERDQSRLRQAAVLSERKAQAEATKSSTIAEFLGEMLTTIVPSVTHGKDTAVLRAVLSETARRVSKDFHGQPEIEAELQVTIGRVYAELGDNEEADAMFRGALELQRNTWGTKDPRLAIALENFAKFLLNHGKAGPAELVADEALFIRKSAFGNQHPLVAASLVQRADIASKRGNLVQAEADLRETLAILKPGVTTNQQGIADALDGLMNLLLDQHRAADAERVFAEVWPEKETSPAPGSFLLHARGELRARTGRWREAVEDFSKWLELEPDNHEIYHFLAPLLVKIGDQDAYLRLCDRIRARFGRTTNDAAVADRMAKDCLILPSTNSDHSTECILADIAVNFGQGYPGEHWFQLCKGLSEYRQGQYGNARQWVEKALLQQGKTPRRDLEALMVLAMADYRLGETDEANKAFAEGAGIAARHPTDPLNGDLGSGWVDWLIADTLMREAENLLRMPSPAVQ